MQKNFGLAIAIAIMVCAVTQGQFGGSGSGSSYSGGGFSGGGFSGVSNRGQMRGLRCPLGR